MGIESLLIGLGITGLVAIAFFFSASRDTIFEILKTARDFLSQLIQTAPPLLKIIFFLFLMVFVVGGSINLVTNSMFFCDNGVIRKPTTFMGGVIIQTVLIASQFTNESINDTDFNSLLQNETVIYYNPNVGKPEGMFQVRCINSKAQLTLWGIPIFDFRTWLIILLLGGFIKLYLYLKQK